MWRRMIHALERPATTASATKSCSLIASVSPRIWRAKRGHSSSAITRTTLRKLGSETATITTAMRIVGSDSPMSVSRMRMASVTPAAVAGDQPEQRPERPRHADRDQRDDERDAAAVDDPAQHVAPEAVGPERMLGSPRSIHIGGISFLRMSPSVGLCGARTRRQQPPSPPARREPAAANHGSRAYARSMADPRVEVAVQQVHEEVAGEVEGAQHQHARLHDRVVARGDATPG